MQTVEESNVKRKLMKARLQLQSIGMQKSGIGVAGGGRSYRYYELSDILPHITRIFNSLGLISVFTIDASGAQLRISDVDFDEEIVFRSPFPDISQLQSSRSPMQELGCMHTYLRRYLFINALDICEPDVIELSATPPDFAIATKKEIENCKTIDQLQNIKKKAQLIKWPPEDRAILNSAYKNAQKRLLKPAVAV